MNEALLIQDALDAVMPNVRNSGLLSSLCTIQRPSGNQGASGAPDGLYVSVAGLVGIACRLAPLSNYRPSADEQRQADQTKTDEPKHCLLDAYYPTVRDAWLGDGVNLGAGRAVIDGRPYTIMGVEPDGTPEMTRMKVEVCQI